MTPRPGQVSRIIPVDMAYPRDRVSAEFVEIRNQILKTLNFAVSK